MSATRFVDVSFTDGQSAAWAGALEAPMLCAAAQSLDGARFAAIEAISPEVMSQCLSRGENPLQRLEDIRRWAPTARLRAVVDLIPRHGRFDELGTGLLRAWLRLLAEKGVSEVVLVDPWGDLGRMTRAIRLSKEQGLEPIAALVYPTGASQAHDELAQLAQAFVKGGAARIMLRDEAGLLSTGDLGALIPTLRAAIGPAELDLHTHCHTGLGPQVALEAIRLGIARLDTVLPCVANGPSLPSSLHMSHSAALLGLEIQGVATQPVEEANAALLRVAAQENFPESQPWAFDLAHFMAALPGPLAARAMQAAKACGRDGFHRFAKECESVRRELGQPPMLGPYAEDVMKMALSHLAGAPRFGRIYPSMRRLLQQKGGGFSQAALHLRQRVGRSETTREAPPPPNDETGLLAMMCGIAPAGVPARQQKHYELMSPEEALTQGLLARWATYPSLTVTGPGLHIQLSHSRGAQSC